MNSCWALLHELQYKQWLDEITRKPKLRTYITFKNSYEVEPYALMSKEFVGYFAKIISDMIEVRHVELFVKT